VLRIALNKLNTASCATMSNRAIHFPDPGDETASLFELLAARNSARCLFWTDEVSGLRAVLVLDDLTLGPAAGGTRTRAYASLTEAVADAADLARAMTLKCAISGIDAGGGKAVILDRPGLDRSRLFARFGAFVEELGGLFRTAGDLGTTLTDLMTMARHTRYVVTDEAGQSAASARTVLRSIEACAAIAGKRDLRGLRVAVQGCGSIGAAVARELAAAGATLLVADIDHARAASLAASTGGRVIDPRAVLSADCDVLSPCALGGVLTPEVADQVRAWAVCGAANNIVASPVAEQRLLERGILFVPDFIASAGAVILGVCRSIMHVTDHEQRIDALGETAREVLAESRASGRTATAIAQARAWARIERARRDQGRSSDLDAGPTW
jgi:leucine dehydrogenase